MKREHLFAGFFLVAFLFLLYQLGRILFFFVGPLSWAALLALIFYPLQQRLVRVVRHREGLAAFILTTAVILIVIVPTIYLTAVLATESVTLYQAVRVFVESGRLSELMEHAHTSFLGRFRDVFPSHPETWNIDLPTVALKASNAVSGFLVSQAPAAAANILHFVTSFFFTTFALFFFFRDGERMVASLRELIPMAPAHKDAVLMRLYDTLSAVVQGSLVTALVQGLLAGIGFWALAVPFAILLGGATAFLSLIPFAGPVVWMSVVVYLAATGEHVHALLLLVWGSAVVSSADNVLRPLIIGGRTQIPTVFLFFSILGGVQAYGFLGVFLGPTVIAILVAFVRIYREEYAITPPPGAAIDSEEQ